MCPSRKTKRLAEERRRKGEFDRVFYTQIFPENANNFDGTTRTSTFRSYPGKITVPVQPVLRRLDREIENVTRFAAQHELAKYKHVVLFESAPGSGQSSLTPELAIRVARRVAAARSDTVFVLSSHVRFQSDMPAVIDASALTYRENAELSKHCTLLIGGSSGITWLTTSSAAKDLPKIQFLRGVETWFSFASVKYDHAFFGLDHRHVFETDRSSEGDMVDVVERYLSQGSFDGMVGREFKPSIDQVYWLYRVTNGDLDVRRVLSNFVERNPSVAPSEFAFYRGLATVIVKMRARSILARARALTKRT